MSKSNTRLAAPCAVLAVVGVLLFLLQRPAHPAGGAVPVQVTGTVATTRLDEPDAQPFGIRIDASLASGYAIQSFTVPAGKRLIVDYISGQTGAPSGARVVVILATYINGQECESHPSMIAGGVFLGRDVYTASDAVRISADPGSTVSLSGSASSSAASSFMTFSIYGHYINYP